MKLIGIFNENEEIVYFFTIYKKQITCVGVDTGHTTWSGFIDSNSVNTPPSREMEGRLFYTVCRTPNWSSMMFGTMCSGTPILCSRLSGTMCSDRMEWYGRILLAKIMCVKTLWLYFRNAWRETIIESLRFLKCVLSFIYFVKMSLGLMIPGMWSTSTSFDWWNSRTIFYWRFRCLIPFEVTEFAHWTAALLLLYILMR